MNIHESHEFNIPVVSNSSTTKRNRSNISSMNNEHYTMKKLKSLNWLKKQNFEV